MFLDIQMPILDGPSTLLALRQKGYKFPVIASSASAFISKDCNGSSFDGFLPKPINGVVLKKLLRDYTENQKRRVRSVMMSSGICLCGCIHNTVRGVHELQLFSMFLLLLLLGVHRWCSHCC